MSLRNWCWFAQKVPALRKMSIVIPEIRVSFFRKPDSDIPEGIGPAYIASHKAGWENKSRARCHTV
jgi:hypothetical protein